LLDIINDYNIEIDLDTILDITKKYTKKDIELIIVNDSDIREINRDLRKIDSATDVLSLPLVDMPFSPLGTIFISYEYASKYASIYNHSLSTEITVLFIHGLLHLLGYDHEIDDGTMREKEIEIAKSYNIVYPLMGR
jgi:probable rRNA maturation factor